MTMTAREQVWQRLRQQAADLQHRHLRALFAEDPQRAARFGRQLGPLYLDLSRQRWDEKVLVALCELAEVSGLSEQIEALFRGEPVNATENRPALHMALRQQTDTPLWVEGENVIQAVRMQWQQMARLVAQLHAGQWRGYAGHAMTDVVHIGVGGSSLGPELVVDALQEFRHPDCRLRLHYVSNLDGRELGRLMRCLNPETTLFVVTSKTFTTVDTLSNAETALDWLMSASGLSRQMLIRLHVIGISAAPERMTAWGIPPENQLHFWDWVGGRYSLWSAVGFTIALWLGMDGFHALLQGGWRVDEHFRKTPFADNLPVLMALAGIWNRNFLDIHAQAILPYDVRLQLLPRYLEQLEMESNGKSVTVTGEPVQWHTCPVLWGETGPNAQHAFYQLLHQGTETVACEFIATIQTGQCGARLAYHQKLNLANCLAQSRALALGEDHEDPHRRYPGNRPSSTLLLDRLTPESLGMLIALYEHKVFVQAVIWQINPFDQWGVELGKRIARNVLDVLEDRAEAGQLDAATRHLVRHIRQREQMRCD